MVRVKFRTLSKWDIEILNKISKGKSPKEKKFMRDEYRRLIFEKGLGREEILDQWSHGNADTRWIYYLKSSPKKLKDVS